MKITRKEPDAYPYSSKQLETGDIVQSNCIKDSVYLVVEDGNGLGEKFIISLTGNFVAPISSYKNDKFRKLNAELVIK